MADALNHYTINFVNDAECSIHNASSSCNTGAMNGLISCEASADQQLGLQRIHMNSNNFIMNNSVDNCTNLNQSTTPVCHSLSIEGIMGNTGSNDFSHSPNIHNDAILANMTFKLPEHDFTYENKEPLAIDDEDTNENETSNSQSQSRLFNAQFEDAESPVQNNNLQVNRCIPPFADNLIEPFQSELHIDIDSDDTMHSWRPNTSSTNPDCSFFLSHHLPSNANAENVKVLKTIQENDSQSSLESYWEEVSRSNYQDKSQAQLPVLSLRDDNGANIDLQSQIRCQKVQVNILKYELAKTKLELHKWRERIQDLERELKEKLHFPNIHEIMLLNEENVKLRKECQCLCIEVDFYVKEKAPLGEVNEDFYKGLIKKKEKKEDKEEPEESNTWECSVCTFANHPQINSCEICHSQRGRPNTERHCPSLNAACYCHSNEGSLPISS